MTNPQTPAPRRRRSHGMGFKVRRDLWMKLKNDTPILVNGVAMSHCLLDDEGLHIFSSGEELPKTFDGFLSRPGYKFTMKLPPRKDTPDE